jgi:hypothetical protein
MYASAVAITQALQSHGVDPSECSNFTSAEIHYICTSNGVFTFDEDVVFKIATLMLEERHNWSYSNRKK